MDKSICVLITGSGTVTCQSVIKGLRRQSELNVKIVTVDPNPRSAGRYFSDAFATVPLAKDPDFLDALLDICAREKVQLVVPIVDYEFDKIAQNTARFEEIGCRVCISSPETIRIANDKRETYAFFTANNILTPRLYSHDEVVQASGDIFPLFLKPRLGRASLDTFRVDSLADLEHYYRLVDDLLIFEHVSGDEYTIDTLSDFDARMIGAVPRQRIETKSGVSYKGITVDEPEMIAAAQQIVEAAGIIGPSNIQCFRTGRGLAFFEINPRFSGTLALTLAAGLNSPLLLAKMVLGEKIEPRIGQYERGIFMMRYWEEVFVDASENKMDIPKLH